MSTTATVIGTTGAVWGLTSETGVLIQRSSAKTTREKNIVRDQTGAAVLVSYYNPTQSYSLEGVTTGTTGVAAAIPGAALTLANANTLNGVAVGGIYTDDVDVAVVNTDFRKITVSASQYPAIT